MAATNAGFVNINSDLGESFGPWVMGNDAEVLKIVKSANVACGFPASDPGVMMDTVKLCTQNAVALVSASRLLLCPRLACWAVFATGSTHLPASRARRPRPGGGGGGLPPFF